MQETQALWLMNRFTVGKISVPVTCALSLWVFENRCKRDNWWSVDLGEWGASMMLGVLWLLSPWSCSCYFHFLNLLYLTLPGSKSILICLRPHPLFWWTYHFFRPDRPFLKGLWSGRHSAFLSGIPASATIPYLQWYVSGRFLCPNFHEPPCCPHASLPPLRLYS